jgi:hydroxyacylglutathione hydrolase
MILETLTVGSLEVNCYVVAAAEKRTALSPAQSEAPGRARALIIDPGDDEEKIIAVLERHHLVPGLVVNTHGHYDHIGCDDCFGVDVCIHTGDAAMLKEPSRNLSVLMGDFYKVRSRIRILEDRQEIRLDGVCLRVIHSPGHTPGSICLLMEEPESGILFSGDTLFHGGVGRTDFHGGSEQALFRSLRDTIMILPDATVVYPGHGPSSTIGREKKNNPFISG